MESSAIILISVSALGHAYWNYVFKKTVDKSEHKLLVYWLCTLISCILFLPVFIFYLVKNPIHYNALIYPATFGFFLALYMLFLTKSYFYHDLSLAYPLSKMIPLFTLLLGLFVLNEYVSTTAFIGIFCMIFGAYSVHLKNFKNFLKPIISLKSKGSIFALLTAVVSAFYGLVSKISLEIMNPFILIYLGFLFALIFYSSIFLFDKELLKNVRNQLRKYKKSVITVGFLDIFGYSLVLIALVGNKLSYVFALRQMSIIFAVFLGSRILNEKYGKTRLISAILIFTGVVLISMST